MDASGYIEKLNVQLMNRSLTRLEKGYTFEMLIQNILEDMNIEHEGNSKNPVDWLKSTSTGFDVKIKTLKGTWLTVECKLCLKPVYHCWVERDWLSRTAEIFVTNDPFSISYKDRLEIDRRGKKLMSITGFIIFLQKLFKKERTMKGNQYPVLESLKYLYINIRRRIFTPSYCYNMPNHNETKQRTLLWFLFRLSVGLNFIGQGGMEVFGVGLGLKNTAFIPSSTLYFSPYPLPRGFQDSHPRKTLKTNETVRLSEWKSIAGIACEEVWSKSITHLLKNFPYPYHTKRLIFENKENILDFKGSCLWMSIDLIITNGS